MRVVLRYVVLWVLLLAAVPVRAQGPNQANDPYLALSVEDLAGRLYGQGELALGEVLAVTPEFERWLIAYPSDGLTIYGFMNVPVGAGPFPVVIALHGYIEPGKYSTLDYTTPYADHLARAGYLVLHPNLRGYWPSDNGPNLFRLGMAVDVLNLIALVRQQGGLPGPLQLADPEAIGLWGHSMGGGISLRVLTVAPYVDAAVLYGAMSGDEARNFAAIYEWSGHTRGRAELDIAPEIAHRVSPIHYLDRISAAVSVHHGGGDELVPLDWSTELCTLLTGLGKTVECFAYDAQPHTFYGDANRLFVQRTIAFFDRTLRGGDSFLIP